MSKNNENKKVAVKAKSTKVKPQTEKSLAEKKTEKIPGKRGRAQRIPWGMVKPILGKNTDSEILSALVANGIPVTQPAIFGFRRKCVEEDLKAGNDGKKFQVEKYLPKSDEKVKALTETFRAKLSTAKPEAKQVVKAPKSEAKAPKGKAKIQKPKSTEATNEAIEKALEETSEETKA